MLSFTAYGKPAPKGSTKAFFRPGMKYPVVTEDNKNTRPWAAIVKDAARQAVSSNSIPFEFGPVSIEVTFYMPKPQSMPKRVQWHTKKPDLDKLMRAILDALKGVIWTDDAQVVQIQATKDYAVGSMPRAEIQVRSADSLQETSNG